MEVVMMKHKVPECITLISQWWMGLWAWDVVYSTNEDGVCYE